MDKVTNVGECDGRYVYLVLTAQLFPFVQSISAVCLPVALPDHGDADPVRAPEVPTKYNSVMRGQCRDGSDLLQVVISEEQFLSSDPSAQSASPSQSQRRGTQRPSEHLSSDLSQLRATGTALGRATALSRPSKYPVRA